VTDKQDPAIMELAIEQLKKEVTQLKRRASRLESKKERFDIQGFQAQLNVLNDKVEKLSSDFISISRVGYLAHLDSLRLHARMIIYLDGNADSDAQRSCKSGIDVYYFKTTERLHHLNSKEEMLKEIDAFWNDMNGVLERGGFPILQKVK